MNESIEIFSVDGGKYHKPAEPIDSRDSRTAWKPTRTACGRTVTPQNYFRTMQDANAHTGGRLAKWLCQHCAAI